MNCDKCGRSVTKIRRWFGDGWPGPAVLNDEFQDGDEITWLEMAPGQFIEANHHDCPGSLEDWHERWKREKLRQGLGLDPKQKRRPVKGQWKLL